MKAMVVGAAGMLGSELMKLLGNRGIGCDLPDFDVADINSVKDTIAREKPDVIVNTSAIADVDFCEQNPKLADRVHNTGVKNLAASGIRLITLSTDQVFSNGCERYLLESDPTEPVNVYAASKLRGEHAALSYPGNCVVRTSWLFGEKGLLPWIVSKLRNEGFVTAVTDQTSCVTSVVSLAGILVGMAVDSEKTGLYHCVNRGAITPFELASRVRDKIGTGIVIDSKWSELGLPAKRPVWSALGSERGIELPSLEEVMELCLKKML